MAAMVRVVVLLVLPWIVLGCADASDSRRQAVRCAETWKARGFDFDPDALTCKQMFERAQATWKAEYWRKLGYVFDPATMTAEEMDRQGRALQQAEQMPPQAGSTATARPPMPERQPAPDAVKETAKPEAPESPADAKTAGNGTPVQAKPAEANGGAPAAAAPVPSDPKAEANLRKMLKGMTLADVRAQYPQYNDLDDVDLARRIHAKYFSDTPFDEFARRFFGYSK